VGLGMLAVDALVHFAAVDGDLQRAGHPDSDAFTADGRDRDNDVIANSNLLANLATENQHCPFLRVRTNDKNTWGAW
jgi:hypothetical protein